MIDPLRALIAKWESRCDHGFDPEETDDLVAYWNGARAVLRDLDALLSAPVGSPRGCINCGEAEQGGYMTGREGHTDEGAVGPFCAECWQLIQDDAAPVGSPPPQDDIMAKIHKYRIYSNRGARGATGTSFTGPHYNPADLCEAQTRAIDQLLEYLDPKCDSYLTALVEDAVSREASAPRGGGPLQDHEDSESRVDGERLSGGHDLPQRATGDK